MDILVQGYHSGKSYGAPPSDSGGAHSWSLCFITRVLGQGQDCPARTKETSPVVKFAVRLVICRPTSRMRADELHRVLFLQLLGES